MAELLPYFGMHIWLGFQKVVACACWAATARKVYVQDADSLSSLVRLGACGRGANYASLYRLAHVHCTMHFIACAVRLWVKHTAHAVLGNSQHAVHH
jgi:hypothetical protein